MCSKYSTSVQLLFWNTHEYLIAANTDSQREADPYASFIGIHDYVSVGYTWPTLGLLLSSFVNYSICYEKKLSF